MTRNEMHDLVMGVALVALAYAVYHHQKAVQAAKYIAPYDQAAIDTAIASGPGLPPINVPPPIAIEGSAATGYTADTGSTDWLSQIESMLKGAL